VHADPVKCLAGIGKASASFAQVKMKLLQKCAQGFAKKGVSGTCPDSKTAEKIAAAETKTTGAIAKACGGKDKTCGTADEGEDTVASIGWPSTCMNFEAGSCSGTINDCAGIGTCVTCIGENAVDQAVSLY